jgi:hypothetical protein
MRRCEMKSDLEFMVDYDMYVNGFDPANKDDVIAYWAYMLP